MCEYTIKVLSVNKIINYAQCVLRFPLATDPLAFFLGFELFDEAALLQLCTCIPPNRRASPHIRACPLYKGTPLSWKRTYKKKGTTVFFREHKGLSKIRTSDILKKEPHSLFENQQKKYTPSRIVVRKLP